MLELLLGLYEGSEVFVVAGPVLLPRGQGQRPMLAMLSSSIAITAIWSLGTRSVAVLARS